MRFYEQFYGFHALRTVGKCTSGHLFSYVQWIALATNPIQRESQTYGAILTLTLIITIALIVLQREKNTSQFYPLRTTTGSNSERKTQNIKQNRKGVSEITNVCEIFLFALKT